MSFNRTQRLAAAIPIIVAQDSPANAQVIGQVASLGTFAAQVDQTAGRQMTVGSFTAQFVISSIASTGFGIPLNVQCTIYLNGQAIGQAVMSVRQQISPADNPYILLYSGTVQLPNAITVYDTDHIDIGLIATNSGSVDTRDTPSTTWSASITVAQQPTPVLTVTGGLGLGGASSIAPGVSPGVSPGIPGSSKNPIGGN